MTKLQTLPEFGERALAYIGTLCARGSMPNALIVNGADGEVLRKYATYLAAAVACEAGDKLCGICEGCRRVLNKITPDVIDVFPEDGKQSINVDQARRIRADAYIAPSELDFKVYILHEADKMNSQAQNALLKILEEPPIFASFVLLSSNPAAFLPTVRSRCQLVNVEVPEKRTRSKSSKQLALADRTLEILVGSRKSELVDLLVSISSDRQEYRAYISALMQAFRDIMAHKSGSCDLVFFEDPERCDFYASNFSENAVMNAYDILSSALIENNANIYILLSQTRLMSGLWQSIHP